MGGSTQFAELAWLLRSAEFCTASCKSLLCILYRCYSLSLSTFEGYITARADTIVIRVQYSYNIEQL